MRAVVVIAVLLLAGCGEAADDAAPSELTGVIVDVTSSGLNEVSSFELRAEGENHTISIADDVDYGFPLGHLQEHVASAGPVKVELEERDGELIALTIEDA